MLWPVENDTYCCKVYWMPLQFALSKVPGCLPNNRIWKGQKGRQSLDCLFLLWSSLRRVHWLCEHQLHKNNYGHVETKRGKSGQSDKRRWSTYNKCLLQVSISRLFTINNIFWSPMNLGGQCQDQPCWWMEAGPAAGRHPAPCSSSLPTPLSAGSWVDT